MWFAVWLSNWKPKSATCYVPTKKDCFKKHFSVSCLLDLGNVCIKCQLGGVALDHKSQILVLTEGATWWSSLNSNNQAANSTVYFPWPGPKSIQFIGKRQFWFEGRRARVRVIPSLWQQSAKSWFISTLIYTNVSQTNVVYIKIDLFCLLAHKRFWDRTIWFKSSRICLRGKDLIQLPAGN